MNTISRFKAYELMKETSAKGSFFSVTFVKRTDNTLRKMNCRLGVRKFLKGGKLPYDPLEKGLLPVYDVVKKGYRTINLETVTELSVGGKSYVVEHQGGVHA